MKLKLKEVFLVESSFLAVLCLEASLKSSLDLRKKPRNNLKESEMCIYQSKFGTLLHSVHFMSRKQVPFE